VSVLQSKVNYLGCIFWGDFITGKGLLLLQESFSFAVNGHTPFFKNFFRTDGTAQKKAAANKICCC